MKFNKTILLYTLCTLIFAIKFAYASNDDDDDDGFVDILGDLMIGVAIAICQESAVCFAFMHVISVLFIIVGFITWSCGGCGDKFEWPSKKQITRGLRIGGAYGATKVLRNIR